MCALAGIVAAAFEVFGPLVASTKAVLSFDRKHGLPVLDVAGLLAVCCFAMDRVADGHCGGLNKPEEALPTDSWCLWRGAARGVADSVGVLHRELLAAGLADCLLTKADNLVAVSAGNRSSGLQHNALALTY